MSLVGKRVKFSKPMLDDLRNYSTYGTTTGYSVDITAVKTWRGRVIREMPSGWIKVVWEVRGVTHSARYPKDELEFCPEG